MLITVFSLAHLCFIIGISAKNSEEWRENVFFLPCTFFLTLCLIPEVAGFKGKVWKAGRQASVFCYFETANMTAKHMCRGGKNWLFGNYQRPRAALSSHSLLAKVFTEKESWHPRESGY